jgi:hypothetical protein
MVSPVLRPVVVAVDGSDACVRALVWAFRYAAPLGLPVVALTTWPLHGETCGAPRRHTVLDPRWLAREVQAEAVARALAAVEEVPSYHLEVDNAELVDALIKAGERASMVVIGCDGPEDTNPARVHLVDRVRHEVHAPVTVVGPDGPLPAPAHEQDRQHGPGR